MNDDRGQALVFAVLLLGISAIVLIGLREVQERILDSVRDDRAGEAAVAAAGTVVSDALFRASDEGRGHPTQAAVAGIASDGATWDAARMAASAVARANGRDDPSEVSVLAYGVELEVHLTLAGVRHIALIEPAP